MSMEACCLEHILLSLVLVAGRSPVPPSPFNTMSVLTQYMLLLMMLCPGVYASAKPGLH